jgi:hypothetical protein
MAIRGLGFSVHLRETNIMAHFREVIHKQSFWEVFTPKGSEVKLWDVNCVQNNMHVKRLEESRTRIGGARLV